MYYYLFSGFADRGDH